MLFRQGNHQEAYKVYSEALDIDPLNTLTNAKLYCNRALVGSKVRWFKLIAAPGIMIMFR